METYLTRITDYLLTQSWQLALLVVVIAAVSLVLRNKSAHVRYLLWLIVLAKCFAPPLLTVPLAILPQEKPAMLFEVVGTTISEPLESPSDPVKTAPAPMVRERPTKFTIHEWLGAGWIVGTAVFLVFNLLKALRANYWLWRKRKALSAELRRDIENLFSAHRIKSFPGIWQIDGISQPFVWGLLRGSIYLPANFLNIKKPEHQKSVLGHELSHVIRFDAAVNFLQVIAQAIFWFHPFVWWANRKIRAEREKCCDEMAVARLNASPKDYSKAILEILAAKHKQTRPVPSLAVAGPVKNIEERIKTIMKPGKKFYKRPSLIAATVVLLAALLTVPTALLLTARAGTRLATQPLHKAAVAGDIEQVKLLISKGADVNAKNEDGWTPLHSASQSGRRDVVDFLIAKGADVNARDVLDQTPLHRVAAYGHKDLAELLIAKGADVKAQSKGAGTYGTALHAAATEGHEDVAELLIANGADVNAKDSQGRTPLHRAAGRGCKNVAEFLLTKRADVNAEDRNGHTPVDAALGRGNTKPVVKLLIAKGAKVSPLHSAAYIGDLIKVKAVLEEGANINAKDKHGRLPLYYAATKEVAELLLAKGADLGTEARSRRSPLYWAAFFGHKEVAEFLIAKGANVNAKDRYGYTPLEAAATEGHHYLVELLIAKGADINAGQNKTWTALHAAVTVGHKNVAELLIAKGADVNAKDRDGDTPLYLAWKSDIAELLIVNGADLKAKNEKGQTPMSHWKEVGTGEIAELLRKHGAKE